MSHATQSDTDAPPSPADAFESLPDDAVVGRDDHRNAPGVVVRADAVDSVLRTLRDEAGFDHLTCVTAQQYADRYETIYHLTSYDDRTREVSVVVPVPASDPVSESGAVAFRTAAWHEREAYDLRGPSFSNLQALPEMAEGEYLPDLIATLGSLDTIMGEVDR